MEVGMMTNDKVKPRTTGSGPLKEMVKKSSFRMQTKVSFSKPCDPPGLLPVEHEALATAPLSYIIPQEKFFPLLIHKSLLPLLFHYAICNKEVLWIGLRGYCKDSSKNIHNYHIFNVFNQSSFLTFHDEVVLSYFLTHLTTEPKTI
jgi:hypothetical protein